MFCLCLCVGTNQTCTIYDFGLQDENVCVTPGVYLEKIMFPEICQRFDDKPEQVPRYLFKTKCHKAVHEMREMKELNDFLGMLSFEAQIQFLKDVATSPLNDPRFLQEYAVDVRPLHVELKHVLTHAADVNCFAFRFFFFFFLTLYFLFAFILFYFFV